MASYSITCTCGQVMAIDAASRAQAVATLQAGMTQAAIEQHFREHHTPSEARPTVEQTHAMIEQLVAPTA